MADLQNKEPKVVSKAKQTGQAESIVKKYFSVFVRAKKNTKSSRGMSKTQSRLDRKLSQRLDSAGFFDMAEEISKLSKPRHGFFESIAAGFRARSTMSKLGIICGGFFSVFVLFGLSLFGLVWYRGFDVPVLRDLAQDPAPVLSMHKRQETEYGVGIHNNKFVIEVAGDVGFRSLGISNKVATDPRFNFALELTPEHDGIEIIPELDLYPGTEYTVTLKKGTMFSNGTALQEDMIWAFITEPEFAVIGITPRDGSDTAPVDAAIEVEFNYKDLSTTDFVNYFSIEPPVTGTFEVHGSKIVFLPSEPLVGLTSYKVSVESGFANSSGDTLTQGSQTVFKVSNHNSEGIYIDQPQMYWSDMSPVISVTQDLWIGLSTYNITAPIEFSLYSTTEMALVDLLKDYKWELTELPESQQLTLVSEFTRTPEESQFFSVDFVDYGIYLLEAYNSQYGRSRYKFVIYSPVGLVQTDARNNDRVWLFDMNQKLPMSDVEVRFYDLDESLEHVYSATTNDSGFAMFEGGGSDLIVANYSGSYAVTCNVANQDYLWNNTGYFAAGENMDHRAFLYTDKPIYRPGDTVRFKAIVREEDDMQYDIPGDTEVYIRVGTGYYYWDNIQKLPLYEEKFEVSSDFGTVTGSFELPSNTDIGSHTIRAIVNGATAGSSMFNVAQYVKPRHMYEMSVSQTLAYNGDSIHVDVVGTDYSGDPASGTRVGIGVYRAELSHANWFDSFDELNELQRSYHGQDTVLTETVVLDGNGRAGFDFSVDINDYGSNLGLYNVYIWSEENYVQYDSESILVAQTGLALFAKADKVSLLEGEDNEVQFGTVVLWDFDHAGGVRVEYAVERIWTEWIEDGEYYDPATKTVKPLYRPAQHSENVVAGEELTTDTDGNASFSLNDLAHGSYSVHAVYYDGLGVSRDLDSIFYVCEAPAHGGVIYSDWENAGEKLKLYFDKEEYEVGDRADITVKTTLEGEGIYMVQRGDVYEWKIVDFSTGIVSLQQEITSEMSPIINVCVWGIDEYVSSAGIMDIVSEQYISNVFISTCQTVSVNSDYGRLEVEVTPDKSAYEPGDEVTLDLQVNDSVGKGVQAEISIDVIDRALLDVVRSAGDGNNLYNVHDAFYSDVRQWAYVRTSMHKYHYSGGDSGGVGAGGGEEPRSNFADIAYWEGTIETDRNGGARISFILPDNMTTWSVQVIAVSSDASVGESSADFVSHKDVSLDSQVPKFLRHGDKLEMALEIKNFSNEDVSGILAVECDGCVGNDFEGTV
ncbi:MAG: MG2 domain-containing protein, partial [Patescibacteria group bacterium]|nr:MG2 domain-containing protein [Patescibacteria group bacterium]